MSKAAELAMVQASMANGKALPAAAVAFSVEASPNPAASSVAIAVETGRKGAIAITAFNALNQRVGAQVSRYSEAGTELFDYDLSTLPPGMYFLQVSQNGQQKTAKVIKQ